MYKLIVEISSRGSGTKTAVLQNEVNLVGPQGVQSSVRNALALVLTSKTGSFTVIPLESVSIIANSRTLPPHVGKIATHGDRFTTSNGFTLAFIRRMSNSVPASTVPIPFLGDEDEDVARKKYLKPKADSKEEISATIPLKEDEDVDQEPATMTVPLPGEDSTIVLGDADAATATLPLKQTQGKETVPLPSATVTLPLAEPAATVTLPLVGATTMPLLDATLATIPEGNESEREASLERQPSKSQRRVVSETELEPGTPKTDSGVGEDITQPNEPESGDATNEENLEQLVTQLEDEDVQANEFKDTEPDDDLEKSELRNTGKGQDAEVASNVSEDMLGGDSDSFDGENDESNGDQPQGNVVGTAEKSREALTPQEKAPERSGGYHAGVENGWYTATPQTELKSRDEEPATITLERPREDYKESFLSEDKQPPSTVKVTPKRRVITDSDSEEDEGAKPMHKPSTTDNSQVAAATVLDSMRRSTSPVTTSPILQNEQFSTTKPQDAKVATPDSSIQSTHEKKSSPPTRLNEETSGKQGDMSDDKNSSRPSRVNRAGEDERKPDVGREKKASRGPKAKSKKDQEANEKGGSTEKPEARTAPTTSTKGSPPESAEEAAPRRSSRSSPKNKDEEPGNKRVKVNHKGSTEAEQSVSGEEEIRPVKGNPKRKKQPETEDAAEEKSDVSPSKRTRGGGKLDGKTSGSSHSAATPTPGGIENQPKRGKKQQAKSPDQEGSSIEKPVRRSQSHPDTGGNDGSDTSASVAEAEGAKPKKTTPKAKANTAVSGSTKTDKGSASKKTASRKGPDGPKIVFTNVEVTDSLRECVAKLNGMILEGNTAKEWSQCTHVVCLKNSLKRTLKLLHAMSLRGPDAPRIVHVDWLVESATQGRLLDEKNFIPFEGSHSMKDAFKLRDRDSSKGLLEGITILVGDKNVQPKLADLQPIIESAGGIAAAATKETLSSSLSKTTVVLGASDTFSKPLMQIIHKQKLSLCAPSWLAQALASYSLTAGQEHISEKGSFFI